MKSSDLIDPYISVTGGRRGCNGVRWAASLVLMSGVVGAPNWDFAPISVTSRLGTSVKWSIQGLTPPPPQTKNTHVPLYHSPYHPPSKGSTDSHYFHQILPIHYVSQWQYLDIELTVNVVHKRSTKQLETWLGFDFVTYNCHVFSSHSCSDCCNPVLNELQTLIYSILGCYSIFKTLLQVWLAVILTTW